MKRLRSADASIALAIFGLALGLRLVYLAEVRSIPFFEHPVVDAKAYDEWARELAAGDWTGDEVFYQAPAYPYFLGVVYAATGSDRFAAHVVQMAMGALSCVLTFFATRRFFGRAAGVVAALLLAVYPPAIFFDGLIQKAGLGLLLTTILILFIGRFQARPSAGPAALCGFALALIALTRENALVFVPLLPLWMSLGFRAAPQRQRAAWVGAFALGLILVLGPVGLRNYRVGGTFALTTAQLGPNFYIGNNPRATGVYAPLLPGRHTPEFEGPDAALLAERVAGRDLSPGEVSSYWLERSLAFIRSQPGDWLLLMGRKALLTVNAFEVPDAEDLYIYATWSALLTGLLRLFHFGILLPLAAAGMVLAWPLRKNAWVLYLLAAAFAASVALFYVFARYRFPLVPLLLPFCGLALARGSAIVRAGDYPRLIAPTSAFLVAAFVANLDIVAESRYRGTAYTNLGIVMIEASRLDEAEVYLQRAAEINSDDPDVQFHLGILRFQQERWSDAEAHFRRMLKVADSDFRGHHMLSMALRRQGRGAEATRHQRRALRLNPNLPRMRRRGEATSRE